MKRRTFLKWAAATPLATQPQPIQPASPQAVTTCAYGSGLYGAAVYNGDCAPTSVTLHSADTEPTLFIPYGVTAGVLLFLSWQIQRIRKNNPSK